MERGPAESAGLRVPRAAVDAVAALRSRAGRDTGDGDAVTGPRLVAAVLALLAVLGRWTRRQERRAKRARWTARANFRREARRAKAAWRAARLRGDRMPARGFVADVSAASRRAMREARERDTAALRARLLEHPMRT
jgi:hypothetical protein